MSEQDLQQPGESSPNADSSSKPIDRKPSSTGTGGGILVLAILAILLALGATAVSGYLWYQVQVEQKNSQYRTIIDMRSAINEGVQNIDLMEKRFDELRATQQAINDQVQITLKDKVDDLEQSQERLADQNQSLVESIEKVYADLDRNLDSWALEEVEQLLRIANHSLLLSSDISTATHGLELADARIQQLANPALLDVREALLKDITALKNLQPPDLAGLALKLSKMADGIDDLPLSQKAQREIKPNEDSSPGSTQTENSWASLGGEILGDLKQLVRIQNLDEPAKPLLTPEQRYFLFSNLRLMLSGAQIATLRRDTSTYRDNLEQAKNWLQSYFDREHQGVSKLLTDIDQMMAVELNPSLPDISASLVKLQEAKRRMKTK